MTCASWCREEGWCSLKLRSTGRRSCKGSASSGSEEGPSVGILPLRLQIWDTAGQESFRSITRHGLVGWLAVPLSVTLPTLAGHITVVQVEHFWLLVLPFFIAWPRWT